ncbi:MAG: gluconokinase [Paracoccus hibiscisoli]|uniref:gluconokinase n=1 Tax=Paracoccus hibiscisoli TaxID=2023261 RepID=UPI00391A2784
MSGAAYVIMGVSGCGKSTIGHALAARLGHAFADGDDLHPASNIAKMSKGQPLTDADRLPWLAAVAAALRPGTVVACSALRRSYRDLLRDSAPAPVVLIHLRGQERCF